MKSTTIQMDRDSALEKLDQYAQAKRRTPRAVTEIDDNIMRGYRILAKGGRLIDVNGAIAAAGLNLAGFPKLAIARAHVAECSWRRTTDYRYTDEYPMGAYFSDGGGDYFYGDQRTRMRDDRVRWKLPPGTFPNTTSKLPVRALAPLIPLPLRPRHCLANYFLLWEANWHPAPPVDPYLLRPIAGSLMEIIAEWDVTPLELAAVTAAMVPRR